MMVWVWKYAGSDAPQWSTCFDIEVEGAAVDSGSSSSYNNKAAAAAAPATTAAPVAPIPVYEGVVQTLWETVDVWTTIWDTKERRHIRQFKP